MRKLKRASIAVVFMLVLSMVTTSFLPVFGNYASAEAATSVKLNKTKIAMNVGKTYQLQVSGSSATATWSTSKKAVATVSTAGKVTAKKAGTATITATVNEKTYSCKVTVKEATTVYGKVTAVSDTKVTLALGTMKRNGGAAPDATSGATPSGTSSNGGQQKPANSSSASDSSGSSSGSTITAPTGTPSGQPGGTAPSGMPELLTLTGETLTITIADTSILSKETMPGPGNNSSSSASSSKTATSGSAALADITVGSILKVTYTSSTKNLTSVVIMGGGQGGSTAAGNPPSGGQPGGTATVSTGTGAYTLKDGESLTSGTYTSTNADENAIRAEGSITASISDVTVSKTAGTASSSDASSFYGLNAAILALDKATLNITGGTVTATPEGSNGVFAYNGATINIKNTTINVSGGNAGGIEVAGGGIMNATNLTVTSDNKAAIRSDRGGGTMTVNGGTYTTTGASGAPAVYSTAAITVNDATLTANASEAVVVEGLNSVTLNNCTVTGNMSGTYGSSGDNIHNVMLYQSMSGDAEVGNSSFTMNGGSLTAKNGDMFYVTNTDCAISLSNAALSLASGTKLLVVAGNNSSRGWGTVGSNGGVCTFTASGQTLAGDITVDSISKLAMSIKNSSTFTGSINSDKTTAASLSVTLDSSSTWTLTADSYVTAFTGSMSNVVTNGHTLYVNGVAQN